MFKEVVKFMVYDKLVVNESRRPKCKRTRPRNWARRKPSTNEVKNNGKSKPVVNVSQCGNFRIFLAISFYVKSNLKNLEVPELTVLQF